MSAKHTPGPWTLDGCEGGWMLLAEGRDITTEPFDADDADAALIAAAPEMLASLQELLALHIAHHNAIEHAAARKLIRRATGDA